MDDRQVPDCHESFVLSLLLELGLAGPEDVRGLKGSLVGQAFFAIPQPCRPARDTELGRVDNASVSCPITECIDRHSIFMCSASWSLFAHSSG